MVDFRKLRTASPAPAPIEARRIFERLPKPDGVNDLWESQGRVLELWEEHRASKDVVIKLNTGGGKTLVGLLIAQASMNARRNANPAAHDAGALYLCANRQLVVQTVARAREFQLPAVAYESGRAALPTDFMNGDAILVGTYRALFHGYSKFQVRGRGAPVRVSAVICDDAHTAFTDVRDAFSVVVTKVRSPVLYQDITARFRSAADAVGRLGSYDQRIGGQNLGVFEVPYWAWREQAAGVRDLLTRHAGGSEYQYQLPLLLDSFGAAHVLVRSTDVMITPLLPSVDLLPTFAECPHRVFMSATIADDSALIRTFDAAPAAVRRPLAPASLAGVGERMILAPALTPVGVEGELAVTKDLCTRVAARGVGVVILVPSEPRANRWAKTGTLVLRDDVASAVDGLTDPARTDNGPYIFANRYDGIDLARDACRLLVLDGTPQGASAYDEYRANVLRGSSQIELSLAQRVEQGMGRGTRGAGDHCVVVLVGNLVDWVARKSNAALMTAATRAQLDLGLEVSKLVQGVDDLEQTVLQCLERDPRWVGTHALELAERASAGAARDGEVEQAIADATVEREYARRYIARDYADAGAVAMTAAAEHREDRLFRGWLLQLAARATFFRYDGGGDGWEPVQMDAARANAGLLTPPGQRISEPLPSAGEQARNIVQLLDEYDQRAAYLADVERTALALTGASPAAQFEEGMRALGRHLGFDSQRLDRGTGTGPDNVWRTTAGEVFVISCKNEKKPNTPLYKKDLQQLLIDTKWVEERHPELRSRPVVVMTGATATDGLPLQGIALLTLDRLGALVAALRTVAGEIARADVSDEAVERLAGDLLVRHHLDARGLPGAYFREFTAQPTARRSADGATS